MAVQIIAFPVVARQNSHGDRFLGIPRCLSLRLILSLFDSRRMSLGGRLCYTIFLTMGTGPAMIELAIMCSQFGHTYKINYKLSLK